MDHISQLYSRQRLCFFGIWIDELEQNMYLKTFRSPFQFLILDECQPSKAVNLFVFTFLPA